MSRPSHPPYPQTPIRGEFTTGSQTPSSWHSCAGASFLQNRLGPSFAQTGQISSAGAPQLSHFHSIAAFRRKQAHRPAAKRAVTKPDAFPCERRRVAEVVFVVEPGSLHSADFSQPRALRQLAAPQTERAHVPATLQPHLAKQRIQLLQRRVLAALDEEPVVRRAHASTCNWTMLPLASRASVSCFGAHASKCLSILVFGSRPPAQLARPHPCRPFRHFGFLGNPSVTSGACHSPSSYRRIAAWSRSASDSSSACGSLSFAWFASAAM
jgi:hypothetical protein